MKKHTNTLIEQTKTRPRETLELKLNEQMETFSFDRLVKISEKDKWVLGVTSSEATNSVFDITDENNSFSITTSGHWKPEDGKGLINKLNMLLELRSENDIEVHVKEVDKKGNEIEIENSGQNLACFDRFKIEILAETKSANYKDVKGMVYGMELTYDEIVDISDVNYIAGSTNGFTLPSGLHEITDMILILKFLLPNRVKVKDTRDDIRLRSNLTINKTIRFKKQSFFYTILGFTQSHSRPMGDIEGFIQIIPCK